MVHVLVTGGAGFIGSHLVDALLARGCRVTVLDDLSSGRMENIKVHLGNPDFRFVRGDVCDEGMVRDALSGVDAVIHEAAVVSVPTSIERPELVQKVNVRGTLNLLRASAELGVGRFVFASSCAVYGEQEKLPIKEDAEPRPLSPYAASKLAAEEVCREFHRLGLCTVCLRYFNVYGPRQASGEYAGVMVKFMERLRAGQPPVIHGDGEQTRDFIHVEDVVEATLLTLERSGVNGEVFNIGTGRETSINELCGLIVGVSGRENLRPVHGPPRAGDIRRSLADISKVRRVLGFEPKVLLENGIRTLWESLWGGVP
jgi:UDP-glucose 4-epimerase